MRARRAVIDAQREELLRWRDARQLPDSSLRILERELDHEERTFPRTTDQWIDDALRLLAVEDAERHRILEVKTGHWAWVLDVHEPPPTEMSC